MPIVGIFSQKGGEGKSTIIDFLSTTIQTKKNPFKNKNRVLVIDADFPQSSIYKLRKLEVDFLKGENQNKEYFLKKYKNLYGENNTVFDVVQKDLLDVPELLEKIRNRYDLVLVDIMGTINTQGFDSNFLTKIDYIVVPTLVDYEDISSNTDFIKNVLLPLKMGRFSLEYKNDNIKNEKQTFIDYKRGVYRKYSSLKDFSVLFNRVENVIDGDIKVVKDLKEKFAASNVKTFENFIYKRKKFGKIHIQYFAAGQKSTIFPPNDVFIDRMVDEFIEFINL